MILKIIYCFYPFCNVDNIPFCSSRQRILLWIVFGRHIYCDRFRVVPSTTTDIVKNMLFHEANHQLSINFMSMNDSNQQGKPQSYINAFSSTWNLLGLANGKWKKLSLFCSRSQYGAMSFNRMTHSRKILSASQNNTKHNYSIEIKPMFVERLVNSSRI